MSGEIQEGVFNFQGNLVGSRRIPNGYKIEGEFKGIDFFKVVAFYDPDGKKHRNGAKIYLIKDIGLMMRPIMRAENLNLNGFKTAIDEVGNIWEGELKNGFLNGKVKVFGLLINQQKIFGRMVLISVN